MRRVWTIVALGAASIGTAGCGDYDRNEQAYDEGNAAYTAGEGEEYGKEGTAAYTTSAWPRGSRIVVEEGVTYRIDPGDVRIRLGPTDSRVEVVDNVRYRIDPDGTRVRIDPQGVEIDVDGDVKARVDADGPSLEVNNSGR